MKKEMNLLKKNYPQRDLAARDYAQYMDTMADVEQKAAMVESQLKDQLAKQNETLAKLQPDADDRKKKLKEDLERNLIAIDNQLKHHVADQTATIKETEDCINAHTRATQTKVKGMEQKAVPLTRKVAAATGEGDPSFLKLDKQYTLVTSEDIVAAEMEQLLTAQGMAAEASNACSLLLMGYMNSKSKVVGPPQAPPEQQAASSQTPQQ